MAYTATVTKAWPTKDNGIMWINVNVVVTEDSVEVLTFTEKAKYNSGTDTIGDVLGCLQDKIKARCDKFISEKTVYDSSAFDTLVSTL